MKRKQKLNYKKCFTGIAGILWVAGLLIAGSESPYMPWINGVGLILFFCASIILGKFFQSIEPIDSKDDKIMAIQLTKQPLLCLKIRFSE